MASYYALKGFNNKTLKGFNNKLNELSEKFAASKGSKTTLINNKIRDIIKVINSLVNRGIFLKGTTKKITSQKGVLLNFLGTLVKTSLALMKDKLKS